MRFSLLSLLFVAMAAFAQEETEEAPPAAAAESESESESESEDGVKTMLGMSILGNEEAPKSLVIVPWKSSQLGDGLGISNALDETPRPVDKEVFMRELHFYGLRSGTDE
jgi:hypothetical protein